MAAQAIRRERAHARPDISTMTSMEIGARVFTNAGARSGLQPYRVPVVNCISVNDEAIQASVSL